MRLLLVLPLMLSMHLCEGSTQKLNSYDDEIAECSNKIQGLLHPALSNAPDFFTIHEMTGWLGEHLPPDVRKRFIDAGNQVSRSLNKWEQSEIIHGPFWNIQLLSELLIAQSSQFTGVAGCDLGADIGVAREIVQDQIFIALNLKNKSVRNSMERLSLSDPHYAKMILIYGVILDFARVTWKDEQIARVVKFSLVSPTELQ